MAVQNILIKIKRYILIGQVHRFRDGTRLIENFTDQIGNEDLFISIFFFDRFFAQTGNRHHQAVLVDAIHGVEWGQIQIFAEWR